MIKQETVSKTPDVIFRLDICDSARFIPHSIWNMRAQKKGLVSSVGITNKDLLWSVWRNVKTYFQAALGHTAYSLDTANRKRKPIRNRYERPNADFSKACLRSRHAVSSHRINMTFDLKAASSKRWTLMNCYKSVRIVSSLVSMRNGTSYFLEPSARFNMRRQKHVFPRLPSRDIYIEMTLASYTNVFIVNCALIISIDLLLTNSLM